MEGVFTDLDGTLTTAGLLLPSTFQALWSLRRADVAVVVVTGRPAGWADALARTWPVRAVVAENGGVTFLPRADGGLRRVYAVSPRKLPPLRRRMVAAAAQVGRACPGARLSSDAPYTQVNLAMDWNEDVHLKESVARTMEGLLRDQGYNAVRSSVHVNFWPGRFDKLTACRRVVRELFGRQRDLTPYLYVGDALNDAPMFAGFPRSVGVANVRAVWDELPTKPAHVTRAAEGRGFEEVARAVLRARR